MNQYEAYARALGAAEAALIGIEIEAKYGMNAEDFRVIRSSAEHALAKIKELIDGVE